MKINRVDAVAFGALAGDSLDLAPGLTVVWGLNEAGKSTWHNAVFASICGVKRGKGKRSREDQAFDDQYRPWTGPAWKLAASVLLDNGDNLTVNWNLDDRVGQVIDARGRDLTSRYLNDGSLDLAKLVGLDRQSFVATACVRQSDVLGVTDSANQLQEFLQRAAATGGVDATASAALAAIDDFKREQVGLDRANSSKPLVHSRRAIEGAREALNLAIADHDGRLQLIEQAQQGSEQAAQTAATLALSRAALRLQLARVAAAAADEAQQRTKRVQRDLASATVLKQALSDQVELARLVEQAAHAQRRLTDAQAAADEISRLERALRIAEEQSRDAQAQLDVVDLAQRNAVLRRRVHTAQQTEAAVNQARQELYEAQHQYTDAQQSLRAAEAAVFSISAREARLDADRAAYLAGRHPVEPKAVGSAEEDARSVAQALQSWTSAPPVPELVGGSSAELRAELDALPELPAGDVAPRPAVEEAERARQAAVAGLEAHERARPAGVLPVTGRGGDELELRRLAEVLAAPVPDLDPLESAAASARAQADPQRRPLVVPVTGAALAVVGVALAVLGILPAVGLSAVGVGLVVFGLVPRRPSSDVVQAAASLDQQLAAARAAHAERAEASNRATDLGLAADSVAIAAAADQLAAARLAADAVDRWEAERADSQIAVATAVAALRRELLAVGAEPGEDPIEALHAYRARCAERASQAAYAGQRADIAARLATREADERARDEAQARQEQAAVALLAVARQIGVLPGRSPDGSAAPGDVAQALESWLQEHDAHVVDLETARTEWQELQTLVADGTLEDLTENARNLEREANEARAALVDPNGGAFPAGPDEERLASNVVPARSALAEAGERLATARARLAEREASTTGEDDAASSDAAVLSEIRAALVERAGVEADAYLAASEAELADQRGHVELVLDGVNADVAGLKGQLVERRANQPDLLAATNDANVAQGAFDTAARSRPEAAIALHDQLGDGNGLTEDSSPASVLSALEVRLRETASEVDVLQGQLQAGPQDQVDPNEAARTLAEAEAEFDRERQAAPHLALDFDPEQLATVEELQEQIDQLIERLEEERRLAAEAHGQLEERSRLALDPLAAREALAEADAEHARVTQLATVLDTTRAYLAAAQERVHRDIAGRLVTVSERWMPRLFDDRYVRVYVDPDSLTVRVGGSGETPRLANRLSRGTAEMLYLVLRMALVEVLTVGSGEVCPLVLDDVTVNFDEERKPMALELLHEMSRERQIVLFTQEDSVRTWAEEELQTDGADRLVVLPGRIANG